MQASFRIRLAPKIKTAYVPPERIKKSVRHIFIQVKPIFILKIRIAVAEEGGI